VSGKSAPEIPKTLTYLLVAVLVLQLVLIGLVASLSSSLAAVEGRLRSVEEGTGAVTAALRDIGRSLEALGANFTARIAAVEQRLKPAVPREFRMAGWWPWPYSGNPYAPGGVGVLYWFGYETLVYFIPGNQTYIPRLAEEWKLEGTKLTIKLRRTTWNDGRPVTADDVITGVYMAQALWSWPYEIKSATKVDDRTVVIEFEEPPGPALLMSIMTSPFVSFAPYSVYGKWLDRAKEVATLGRRIWLMRIAGQTVPEDLRKEYNEKFAALRDEVTAFDPLKTLGIVVSNGLYYLSSVEYDKMVLKLNKGHWQAATASADTVIIYRWTSNEAVWALLIAGELDASHPATPKDLTDQILRTGPKMKMQVVSDLAETPAVVFNFRNPLFRDINLRKALILSLDRSKVRDITFWFQPAYEYAHGVLLSFQDAWLSRDLLNRLTKWSYDRARAESILKAAGYAKGPDGIWRTPDGKPVKFTLSAYAPHSDWVLAAKEIARQWKEFGFDVEVTLIPEGMLGPTLSAGQFDATIEFGSAWWGLGHPYAGYSRIYEGWVGTISGIVELGLNTAEYDTPWGKLKPLDLVRALALEKDPARQREIVEKLAYITNEYLFYLPIVEKGLQIFYSESRWTGWPAPNDPLWTLCPGGIERVYVVLLGSGALKPVGG
jgi:peptide/nickel transport system substrate-binding protein